MMVSHPSGRCGPCCSQVPTGRMRRGSAAMAADTSPGVSSLRRRGTAAGRVVVVTETEALQGAHQTRSPRRRPRAAGRASRLAWLASAAIAMVAAALWLRAPAIPYLVLAAAATVALAIVAALAWRRTRWISAWETVLAVAAALFCVVAARAERTAWRVEHDWPRFSARITDGGARLLQQELARTGASLQASAARALDAPASAAGAFRVLQPLAGARAERGVVLYDAGRPLAWSGVVRVPPDTLAPPLSATLTPFYVVLQASATRGARRAVASAIVHAEPPADRLTIPLDRRIATRTRLAGFEFAAPGDSLGPDAFS